MDFNGSWRLTITSGSVTSTGRLAFSATSTLTAQGVSYAVESWDGVLSGTTGMTGDFTMRFFATSGNPSGSVRYKTNLVGVTRQ
jgi:hypothetical protein